MNEVCKKFSWMLNCVCVCARMCSSRMMMGLCFCFVFKLPVFIHVLTTTVLPHATSRYSNAVPNPHPLTLCVEPYSSDTYPASSEKQKHVRLNLVPANVRMFTYFYNKKMTGVFAIAPKYALQIFMTRLWVVSDDGKSLTLEFVDKGGKLLWWIKNY